MDQPTPTPPEPEVIDDNAAADREARARAYEAVHNKLFVARLVVTVVLIALYLFTGASAELAEGLTSRFGDQWIWVNTVYLLVTLFAFSALMFPLSYYADYYLEHRYELSKQNLNSWLSDYGKGLLVELALTTVFLGIIYALLRFHPETWWWWATGVYVALSVVLSAVYPVWIMPLFHKFEPLADTELTDAVRQFAERSGIAVLGVYRWGLEEKTETANAALTGIGKTRRIILGDTMLDRYSKDEIIAVLAHEVGHFKNHDLLRLLISGTVLAALGFYVADFTLRALVAQLGFAGVADIGAFPLFLFALVTFSVVAMPLSNMYSRRREYAADAYAVRAIGDAEPLVTALEKLADQNLSDKEPAPWIEFMLHSHPSIKRRVARAREIMGNG